MACTHKKNAKSTNYVCIMHILKNGGQKILSHFFCAFGCIGPILPTALKSILTKRFFSFNRYINVGTTTKVKNIIKNRFREFWLSECSKCMQTYKHMKC